VDHESVLRSRFDSDVDWNDGSVHLQHTISNAGQRSFRTSYQHRHISHARTQANPVGFAKLIDLVVNLEYIDKKDFPTLPLLCLGRYHTRCCFEPLGGVLSVSRSKLRQVRNHDSLPESGGDTPRTIDKLHFFSYSIFE